MTPEETFGRLLGLVKAWPVVETRLEASSSTFVLKVEETVALWPAESLRAGTSVTCHDHVEPMLKPPERPQHGVRHCFCPDGNRPAVPSGG